MPQIKKKKRKGIRYYLKIHLIIDNLILFTYNNKHCFFISMNKKENREREIKNKE